MSKNQRQRKPWVIPLHIAIGILGVLAVFACVFKFYALHYYHADEKTIAAIEQSGDAIETRIDKDTYLFYPVSGKVKCGIIFYPGGKVEYSAYRGLMYRLAEEGFVCVLPRMPENLAILSESAASAIPEKVPQIKEWYLAGHSLGGVAASKYIGEHADEFAGMIFCASYTLTDLSESGLRVLSIYGTEDKVMNRGKYAECMSNLPDETETFLIEGGCHSYFGCYGIQEGDGNPTITNEEQIDLVAEEIARWIP